MALRPGGPLGDYVSQADYARENIQQSQAAQPETQHVPRQQIAPDLAASSFSRNLAAEGPAPESPKLTPEEQTAKYNDSIMERNNAERAQKLGHGPQQSEPTDEKKNVYRELAQEIAAQQKQESPDLQQSRQAELGD